MCPHGKAYFIDRGGEMVERLEAEVVKDLTEEIQTIVRRGLKLAVTSCGLLALVPGTAEIGDELW